MTKKYAITGGAGFIGSNLAEALAVGNEVVVVDDLSGGKKENLAGLDVELVEGSILDPHQCQDLQPQMGCTIPPVNEFLFCWDGWNCNR